MANRTVDERRESLRKRTQQARDNRDKLKPERASVLNYEGFDNVVLFEPKSGKDKNRIDILPFVITQEWYSNLRTPLGRPLGLGVGDLDYKLEIPVHKGIGPENQVFLCPKLAFGKKCPICEERFAEFDKPEKEQDKEKARRLKASWRNFYNVFDTENEEKGIQLWSDVSYHNVEKYLLDEADGVTFSDLEEGKTIVIKLREETIESTKTNKKGVNTFLKVADIEFADREPYEEDVLTQTYTLDKMLIMSSYEEMMAALMGVNEEEKEVEEDNIVKEESSKTNIPRRIKNTCPFGEFGKDCNELKECRDCDSTLFDACADANQAFSTVNTDKTESKKEESKEDLKEEKPSGRRSLRRGRNTTTIPEDDVPF